jgi:HK97 family phage portal protein
MQLWPPVSDPATLTRQVWDSVTAQMLPAVGRAMALYGGLISQCDLDQYNGPTPVTPRPSILQTPDPILRSLALFSRVHVEDYLVHGNALHLVTTRKPNGEAGRVTWFPADQWGVDASNGRGYPDYYLNGKKVARREDVVHVQWGYAPGEPWRGWGLVERYLNSLDRIAMQEASERNALKGGAVPSVAVIAPQKTLTQDEADEAASAWERRFNGPARRPGVFPNGTIVQPLSWSAEDQQATLARQMSLTDVANMLNLDPYWLGAPASSHTYRSPGPMFLTLQRISLEPVMRDLEQVWSAAWFPSSAETKFDRNQLTRDDFATSLATLGKAVKDGLMSVEEARLYMSWTAAPLIGELLDPAAAKPEPAAIEGNQDPRLELLPGGQEGTA